MPEQKGDMRGEKAEITADQSKPTGRKGWSSRRRCLETQFGISHTGTGRQIKEQIHATDPDQENVLCVEKRF